LQQQVALLEQEKVALQEIISSTKENIAENPIKVIRLNKEEYSSVKIILL